MNILKDLALLIAFCATPVILLMLILHVHTFIGYWAICPVF